LTEEEIKVTTEEYLVSRHLFKSHDPNLVNVSQDKLLLDIMLNGEEGKGTELLKGKCMETNGVINAIVSDNKACYKISTCDSHGITVQMERVEAVAGVNR